MKKTAFILFFLMIHAPLINAQVVHTNEWISFWSDSSYVLNLHPLPAGSVVRAYDPQGVLCGEFTVDSAGRYGLMPVYRDDATTPNIDEGADPGDTIRFTIDGKPAEASGPDVPVWQSNGDVRKVNLAIKEPEIQVDQPNLSFGIIPLFTEKETTFVIRNVGLKPLVIDSITTDYHFPENIAFSVQNATIGELESLTVRVSFSAKLGFGLVKAGLVIHSNSINNPDFSIQADAYFGTDVISTSEWVSFWGDSSLFYLHPLQPGDVIDVYDPQHVHCGTFTAANEGHYGLIPVYRDDPLTPGTDEGAIEGDTLTFTINGIKADMYGPGQPIWTEQGAVVQLNLRGPGKPDMPVAVMPANGADSLPRTVTVAWTKSPRAETYHLQVSTDSALQGGMVVNDSILTDTSYVVTDLANGTKYYWRINASNIGGTSWWSGVWNFTIASPQIIPMPASLDFGEVAVHDSLTLLLILKDPSVVPLLVDSMYTLTNRFCTDSKSKTIPAGDSVSLKVVFVPSEFGQFRDTLVLRNNSPAGFLRVPLAGSSPPPAMLVTPSPMDFGKVRIDSTAEVIFTITNSSVNSVWVDSLYTRTKYFNVVRTLAVSMIKHGDSIRVTIRFKPDSVGAFSDTLFIANNSPENPFRVPLKGTGTPISGAPEIKDGLPKQYALEQNYPNPFNPTTDFEFRIVNCGFVSLKVYDVLGREVATLVNEVKQPGQYTLQWNADNMPSGVYICKLTAGTFVQTRKLLLIR